MMYYLKLGAILFLICAIAAGVLAYVNGITAPRIKLLQEQKETSSRAELIPDAEFELTRGTVDSSFVYYRALDNQTKALKGYTLIAEQSGYSSVIKTMVGVDPLFNIIAIRVIDQKETPGLGANCTAASFAQMFQGRSLNSLVLDKDGGEISSMAGATITTRAINSSIRIALSKLKAEIQAEEGGGQ